MNIIETILAALPTIVAIGWLLEKALRLLNDITPESWKWDDNLADLLARLLKLFAGKKTDLPGDTK
jgi:hypothetical protein